MDPRQGEALHGRLRGTRRLALGNQRILYTIERDAVVIRAIQHRAVVYRSRSGKRRR
jgi:mRNA-degrading endonuclease RelE of RelBE toxin-antitoxin system